MADQKEALESASNHSASDIKYDATLSYRRRPARKRERNFAAAHLAGAPPEAKRVRRCQTSLFRRDALLHRAHAQIRRRTIIAVQSRARWRAAYVRHSAGPEGRDWVGPAVADDAHLRVSQCLQCPRCIRRPAGAEANKVFDHPGSTARSLPQCRGPVSLRRSVNHRHRSCDYGRSLDVSRARCTRRIRDLGIIVPFDE